MVGEPEPGWWRVARWSLRAHGACLLLSMLMLVLLVGATPSPMASVRPGSRPARWVS